VKIPPTDITFGRSHHIVIDCMTSPGEHFLARPVARWLLGGAVGIAALFALWLTLTLTADATVR
jgi:hypothetical protein